MRWGDRLTSEIQWQLILAEGPGYCWLRSLLFLAATPSFPDSVLKRRSLTESPDRVRVTNSHTCAARLPYRARPDCWCHARRENQSPVCT
jgi:hypothetical protein